MSIALFDNHGVLFPDVVYEAIEEKASPYDSYHKMMPLYYSIQLAWRQITQSTQSIIPKFTVDTW